MLRIGKIKTHICWFLTGCFCAFSGTAFAQSATGESVKFSSPSFPKEPLQYLLYSPANNNHASTKQALLIYLHGNPSIGTNLDQVRSKGLPKLLEEGLALPFIVAAPQLTPSMNTTWDPRIVDAIIEHIRTKNAIDPNRIYLTGLSIGATGTWEYAITYPDKLACIVPAAGWSNPGVICKIKKLPVWAFHGDKDDIVTPYASRNLCNALVKCGGDVRLTELEGARHDIWREVYSYPGLFDWITAHDKSDTVKRRKGYSIDSNTLAYKMPKAVANITGLLANSDSDFYGINGKGATPAIIHFDTAGAVKNITRITNAVNTSWQDIAYSTDGSIYIGDLGNENWKRTTFQFYRISKADLKAPSAKAVKIEFLHDPDQPLTFKGFFCHKESAYMLGISPIRQVFLVKVSLDNSAGPIKSQVIGRLPMLDNINITSVIYHISKNQLMMLSESSIITLQCAGDIEDVSRYVLEKSQLAYKSKKEAITLLPNGLVAFADQNFLGTIDGNLYFFH